MDTFLREANPFSGYAYQWTDAMVYLYTPVIALEKEWTQRRLRSPYVGTWHTADRSATLTLHPDGTAVIRLPAHGYRHRPPLFSPSEGAQHLGEE